MKPSVRKHRPQNGGRVLEVRIESAADEAFAFGLAVDAVAANT
jgi:hypothetical protein